MKSIGIVACVCAAVLAGCAGSGTPAASPSATSPTPTTTQSPAPSPAASTATATASASASPTDTCGPLGTTADQESSDPLAMSSLSGRTMRLGDHPCYERFVFEMQGTGPVPGWSTGYRSPLIADPSGEPVELSGSDAINIVVRVWTISDGQAMPDVVPFTGATRITTQGYTAIKEAAIISSFEGVTQIGLGIDGERPYRASWLNDPPRLVVDVATGS